MGKPERIGQIAASTAILRREAPIEASNVSPATAELPPHIEKFLNVLQTHFASAAGGRRWDEDDTRDYGRQIYSLTGAECRVVFIYLRERHTFRPSVAEVRNAVNACFPPPQTEVIPGHAMAARRSAAALRENAERYAGQDITRKALPPVPGSTPLGMEPGRELARRRIAELRAKTGLPPKRSSNVEV